MRGIVTGGAGFIGSHVVEALLARGDEVVVVDDLSSGKRENVPDGAQLVEADIREALGAVFEEARPEVCFHLAAQVDVRVSVERPGHDAGVNVLGTIEVLEAARAADTQVVFTSTGGAIYGECDGPASEEAPRIFGDGSQTRDYVYAGDVARATLAAAGREGGVFNVGTGNETSVVELYELCRRVAGSSLQAEQAPARLGELQRSVLDISRARRELGWQPEVPLEEGLRQTLESISR